MKTLQVKTVVGDAAAIVAVILAIWALLFRHDSGAVPLAPEPVTPLAPSVDLDVSRLVTKGRGVAHAVLVEFSDFECPFCRRYSVQQFPEIRKAFLDTGVADYYFINFPLSIHPHARLYATAAVCAGIQGRFWEMHDGLFASPVDGDRRVEAETVRLDLAQGEMLSCLQDRVSGREVQRQVDIGKALGLSGTPALFIGLRRSAGIVTLVEKIRVDQSLEAVGQLLAAASSR